MSIYHFHCFFQYFFNELNELIRTLYFDYLCTDDEHWR